ncbi:MAG TPA: N-acetylmuramoyl-L-alanine amidase [Gammaproteobacteria bacterium]|nr:N-acetylmuramoyl-L-alanine amidase [Gammaproteobacteria bacterium]
MKAFFAVLLLCPSLCLAATAQVRDARVSGADGHTEVSFTLSAPADHALFTLSNPDRIVIDLVHARQQPAAFDARGGVVQRIRSAPHGKDGLRIVLDLQEKATPRSFLRSGGRELVVDLYPQGKTATAPVRPVKVARQPVNDGKPAREIVVAVDAGHGGADSGARGAHHLLEKNVTLEIARKLAARINRQPGFKAVLTRDGDYYLKLRERIERARAAHADIFVSIHCDASRGHDADGATVYALSQHGASSEHARWIADRENDADLIGGVSLSDKTNMLASVLLDLSQTATISASLDVGGRVAQDLAKLGPMHRDDVQQAAFVVLKSPDIPSILVETGYITNPHEARQLASSGYQNKVAAAILGGVVKYFDQYPPPGTELALAKARGTATQADAYVAGNGTAYDSFASNRGSR